MISTALNFPVWDLNGINGGLLIAVIAVIHVFVAQFAVGGGFFLVLAERLGHKRGSDRILHWVHRHTSFFLLLTMVFGGLTGVGIWLVISLVSPGGTSLLIREFVYAWAAEWVFFLAEIITLLVYAASFKRTRDKAMHPKDHMILGWAYGVFAFLSLFIINGIISFMLTPGGWLTTGSFWAAFFNPTFWPSLIFRFGLSLSLAGMFGLITATGIHHAETREETVRFCAQWICLPFILMVGGAVWYGMALPEPVRELVQRNTDDIRPFIRAFLDSAPVLFLAGMFLFIKLPQRAYRPYVVAVLLLGLATAGSFEWVRETARRPWLVHGFMYSNGITVEDGKRMNKEGVLAVSGWAQLRAFAGETPQTAGDNDGEKRPLDASAPNAVSPNAIALDAATLDGAQQARFGRFLFTQQCSNCHGLGAPMLDIKPRVRGRGETGVDALLAAQGLINPYMPPFFGTETERKILARWLASLEKAE